MAQQAGIRTGCAQNVSLFLEDGIPDFECRLHSSGDHPQKIDSQDGYGEKETGAMGPAPTYIDEKMDGAATTVPSVEGMEPTEEEKHTLRHVADKLPKSAFLIALIELCERFSYYGLSGPFQNYIQVHTQP